MRGQLFRADDIPELFWLLARLGDCFREDIIADR